MSASNLPECFQCRGTIRDGGILHADELFCGEDCVADYRSGEVEDGHYREQDMQRDEDRCYD